MSRARVTLHYSVVLFCKKLGQFLSRPLPLSALRQNLLLLFLKCKSVEEVATLHEDLTFLAGPVPHCCGKRCDIVLFPVFIRCDFLKTFKCIIPPWFLSVITLCIFEQCAKKRKFLRKFYQRRRFCFALFTWLRQLEHHHKIR